MSRSVLVVFAALSSLAIAGPAGAQSYRDKAVSMGSARSKIEHGGYSNIQNLHREGDSSWMAGARDRSGASAVVGVDSRGRVNRLSH